MLKISIAFVTSHSPALEIHFIKIEKNVLAKPEIDQEIVVVQQEVFCKKLLRLWILVDQNLEFSQYGFPE